MSGKDTVMMVLAFLAGLVLVTLIFSGGQQEQPQKEPPPPGATAASIPAAQTGRMAGLGDGYFVYHSPEERFFLCRNNDGRLQVIDVYKLERKDPTYHAGASGGSSHGWSFESLSREREAVLEAKSGQFEKAVISQDWAKCEQLALEIAAVGGIDFLLERLAPKQDWGGRRAAALALARRGYIETVPVLADMLLEGPEVRDKAAGLLVKLTGEDFSKAAAQLEGGIDAYKDWYKQHDKKTQSNKR